MNLNPGALNFWIFGMAVGTAICSSGPVFGASLGLAIAAGLTFVITILNRMGQ